MTVIEMTSTAFAGFPLFVKIVFILMSVAAGLHIVGMLLQARSFLRCRSQRRPSVETKRPYVSEAERKRIRDSYRAQGLREEFEGFFVLESDEDHHGQDF